MPTVVVLGGKDHKVLFTDIGWSNSDTVAIASAIRGLYGLSSVSSEASAPLNLSPQPADAMVRISGLTADETVEEIHLTNIHGDRRDIPLDDVQMSGVQEAIIRTDDLAAGIYLLEIRSRGRVLRERLLVTH